MTGVRVHLAFGYLRRPLSPPLSPRVSPPLGPVTYPSSQLAGPIVPRPRGGHRRRFSDSDKQWMLQEAAQPGASASEVGPAGTFYANGSRSRRRQRQPSSRYASLTQRQHPQLRAQGRPPHDAASPRCKGSILPRATSTCMSLPHRPCSPTTPPSRRSTAGCGRTRPAGSGSTLAMTAAGTEPIPPAAVDLHSPDRKGVMSPATRVEHYAGLKNFCNVGR
jgi:hypothetical protein